jgi:NAD(P)-dependent dehydrogenase (short-subunit alcohol dehydrogenase family)
MIDVNVGAALWLTQAVAPYLRERGSGAIVHVAARPGLEPTAGQAAYGVSKAALVHLTRVLDLELRPLGIRVNAVAPQLIDTARTRPYLPPRCWRTRSRPRPSPTSSSTWSVPPPRRSAVRSCRPTAPDAGRRGPGRSRPGHSRPGTMRMSRTAPPSRAASAAW